MPELSPPLISLLSGIHFVAAKTDEASFHYIPVKDQTNEFLAEYYLAVPQNSAKSISSLFLEFQKILTEKGHFVSNDVIIGTMIMFTLCPIEKRTNEIINRYFSLIKPRKLKQYLFLEGDVVASEKIYQMKFFDYSIGGMDFDKFELFLKNHAKTDYISRYRDKLKDVPGVEVKSKDVNIFDVYLWLKECGIQVSQMPMLIQDRVNFYLYAISWMQFLKLKKEFYEQQQFITATYGVHYNIEDFENIGCRFINVFYGFLDEPRHGWVFSTIRRQTEISFPDPRLLEDVSAFLKQNGEVLSNSRSPFYGPLKIFSGILAGGESQLANDNVSHAFVDFFVGLDFLLAPDTEKSKKLKGRIALLTYGYFKRTFPAQIIVLDGLYECRNNYVHFGKSVDLNDTVEIRDITKVIIGIMFNLHKKNINKNGDYLKDWLNLIDKYVTRFYERATLPNNREFRELGVFDLDYLVMHRTYQPN